MKTRAVQVARRLAGGLLIALTAAAGPAGAVGSLFDYMGFSDGTVVVEGKTFRVYVQGSRDTLLIQPAMKDMGGQADWPDEDWLSAADLFVKPAGCAISAIAPITRAGASFEAAFVCPIGIDLHQLVRAQRDALKRGEALHP